MQKTTFGEHQAKGPKGPGDLNTAYASELSNQKKKRADTCISRLGLVFVILPKLEEVAKDAAVPFALTVSEVLGRPKFV